jgi:SAM domain (Sterile alpha motif)
MDVAAWLKGLGLERYAPAFRDNDVDAEVLPKLTAEGLISIGVTSVGHRRKLLQRLVDILDQHLSPIKANLWASSARSNCHLWYFARPPHRLAQDHQHHPYDAADQHDDPTDHEAGVETVKR